jgi:hypothetical protein
VPALACAPPVGGTPRIAARDSYQCPTPANARIHWPRAKDVALCGRLDSPVGAGLLPVPVWEVAPAVETTARHEGSGVGVPGPPDLELGLAPCQGCRGVVGWGGLRRGPCSAALGWTR